MNEVLTKPQLQPGNLTIMTGSKPRKGASIEKDGEKAVDRSDVSGYMSRRERVGGTE